MTVIVYLILIIFVIFYCKCWFKKAKLIFQLAQRKPCEVSHLKSIWEIPGPFVLPFLGTKWIFFRRYKISKIHEAYEGKKKKIIITKYIDKLHHCVFIFSFSKFNF